MQCCEASSRMGTKSSWKVGVQMHLSNAAKARGSSLFVHLALVLVIVEIVVSDM